MGAGHPRPAAAPASGPGHEVVALADRQVGGGHEVVEGHLVLDAVPWVQDLEVRGQVAGVRVLPAAVAVDDDVVSGQRRPASTGRARRRPSWPEPSGRRRARSRCRSPGSSPRAACPGRAPAASTAPRCRRWRRRRRRAAAARSTPAESFTADGGFLGQGLTCLPFPTVLWDRSHEQEGRAAATALAPGHGSGAWLTATVVSRVCRRTCAEPPRSPRRRRTRPAPPRGSARGPAP